MSTPGAATSGLSASEYGAGPRDENEAISPELAETCSAGASPTASVSSPPAAAACWARRAPIRSETVSERCWLSETAVGSPAARCA